MAHKLTFTVGTLGKSKDFNNFNYLLMPLGLYEIPSLTRINDATAEVGTFVGYINDSANDLGTRIEIDAAENVSVDPTTPYMIARLNYVPSLANDFILLSSNLGGITSDDIVLGKCNYTGSVLVDFDTTVQTLSPLRNNGATLTNQLNNIFFPSVFTVADYIISSDQKSVTIFVDTTITNRNITFPTADINSVGNYIGVYNIAGANNTVANSTFTILPGRAMYFRCTQTGSSTYAWARIFNDEYQTGTAYPTSTPTHIGQMFLDTTGLVIYISKGVASAADWIRLKSFLEIPVNKTASWTIADTDLTKVYTIDFSSGTRKMITPLLPTLADNIGKILDFKVIGNGIMQLDGEGAETIEGLPYQYCFSNNDYISVLATSTEWKILKHNMNYETGGYNTNDQTNRHYGNVVVTFDGGAGTFVVGEIVREYNEVGHTTATGRFGTIIAVGATTLTLIFVDGVGTFTNDKYLLGMNSGASALVNGASKNADTNILHLTGYCAKNFQISMWVTATTTFDLATAIEVVHIDDYGWSIMGVDTTQFIVQTGDSSLHCTSATGAGTVMTTSDYAFNIYLHRSI
jgi:hypothetical protein